MKKYLLSAAVLTMCAASANAATITNGDFEIVDGLAFNGRGWNYFDSINGWDSTAKKNGVELQSAITNPNIDAQSGDYYAELDSNRNNEIFQYVLFDAGVYDLTFFYSPRIEDTKSTNDMAYSLGTLVSGVIEGAPNPDYAFGEWTEVTSRFTVTEAAEYRLSFAATGKNDSLGAFIDNVSVSAVPLPATAWMLLAGLGALGATKRRRKAA